MEHVYSWLKQNPTRVEQIRWWAIKWIWLFIGLEYLQRNLSPKGFAGFVALTPLLFILVLIVIELSTRRAKKLGPKCYLCGGSTKWSLFFDQDVGASRQTYKCQNRECGNRILIKG